MGINNVLHRRQYKIVIDDTINGLNLDTLGNLGIWSNPKNKHYLVTLRSNEDPNTDIGTFIKAFENSVPNRSINFAKSS